MAQRMLNIEVGEKFIKICVSQGTSKSYKVTSGFRFEYEGNLVSDGQIMNVAALGDLIGNAIIEHNLGDVKKATFVFSSTKVPVREVSLPPARLDRLEALVKANAGDYFPVDIANYHVTHTVLEKVSDPEPAMRVLVTAVPLVIIRSYFELANYIGIGLHAIDYAPNSQLQVLSSVVREGITMYLSVNMTNSTSTFIENGVLLLQRNVPIGGDEIVAAVMQATNSEPSQYMQILEQCTHGNWLETAIPQDLRTAAMGRLISGIGRMLEFFRSNQKSSAVDRIVLLGDSAHIFGLSEAISETLGVQTEILSTIPKHERGVEALKDELVSYVSCVGSIIDPLNLLPDSMTKSEKKSKQDNLTASVLLCTLAVVAGVGLSATAFFENMQKQSELEGINREIEELQYVVDTYNSYTEYAEMDYNLTVFTDNAAGNNENLVPFIEELESIIPENIIILNAICSEQSVTLNATVESFEEVAVTLANINAMQTIDVVSISGASESVSTDGAVNVSFSVTAIYSTSEEVPPSLPQPILTEPETEATTAEATN